MGHRHHHQAANSLVNLLTEANHDLTAVQFKLEREFQLVYPDSVIRYISIIPPANPVKLVNRIKKIQEEIGSLNDQCRELLVAKQDLIDKARTVLVGNRSLLQRMQASMGIPQVNVDEDPAFANFSQIIDEWTVQVKSKAGDERHDSDAEDINKLLFSAIVQSN